MNLLIVEDEAAAASRLQHLVQDTAPDAQILAVLDSVESATAWLGTQPAPDLILMDIQLADGLSFEIFREVQVEAPVIFTTAYDDYALQAFKVNSIDYLLKPIKREELAAAFDKYRKRVAAQQPAAPVDYRRLLDLLPGLTAPSYQQRIVVRYGAHIRAIEIAEAAYIFLESKIAILRGFDGKDHPVDYTLDELEQILNPKQFFRINRKLIVNVSAIDQMYAYSKSRVQLTLKPPYAGEALVSSERAAEFKQWLAG
jgi:two-component system LytT family response regulator